MVSNSSHQPRFFIIQSAGIDWKRNPTSSFTKRSGEATTYINYVQEQYKSIVRCLTQPLLFHKSLNGKDTLYLIPELCYQTGLSERNKTKKLANDLGSHTRTGPERRQQALNKFVRTFFENEKVKQLFEQWGVGLQETMTNVDSFTFHPQKIKLKNGTVPATKVKADWPELYKHGTVQKPIPIHDWIVVYPYKEIAAVTNLIAGLIQISAELGIPVEPPKYIDLDFDEKSDYCNAILRGATKSTQLAVCIFSNANKERYDGIKQLCNIELGIASQCLNNRALTKHTSYLFSKVMMQITSKLGGELWHVDLPISSLMVIGIDVCHDSAHTK